MRDLEKLVMGSCKEREKIRGFYGSAEGGARAKKAMGGGISSNVVTKDPRATANKNIPSKTTRPEVLTKAPTPAPVSAPAAPAAAAPTPAPAQSQMYNRLATPQALRKGGRVKKAMGGVGKIRKGQYGAGAEKME